MYTNKIYTVEELEPKVKKLNLIQLYIWLHEDRLDHLKNELVRIGSDKRRQAFLVRRHSMYTLFVDNIAEKKG